MTIFTKRAQSWAWLLSAPLALGAVSYVGLSAAWADEPAVKEAPAAEAEKPADPLAVPAEGTAADYVEFVRKASGTRLPARTREEYMANILKIQTAVNAGAAKALAAEGLTDQQMQMVVGAKFTALSQLQQLGQDGAAAEMKEFIASLVANEKAEIAALGKKLQLQQAVMTIGTATPEERQATVEQLMTMLKDDGVTGETFGMAMMAGRGLEQADPKLAASFYTNVSELAAKSDNPQIVAQAEKLQGVARRVNLVGNEMEITGNYFGGDELKWADYRGKVVLVDFWATWCGPCIAEIPNVKENYDLYHSRGFEVLGISLDTDKDRVAKFLEDKEIPWKTLYSEEEGKTGWDNPMAQYYGIMGIPTAILVDQEGKVVTLTARGEELGKQLETLIGPAATETTEAPGEDAAEEAAAEPETK